MDSEIEERGSILFGAGKGMTGKLASKLIDDGVIDDLMPPQKSYRKKRRKEIRRVLYNLIRAESLSRAYSREIKVAVPLTMIHDNRKEYHRVSHRGVKNVISSFSEAGLIGIERGRPLLQCPTSWKKKCVKKNNLKGKMTEIWARGSLKEKIGDYLDESTHVGADVEILVEENAVVLKDNEGKYIRMEKSPEARRMSETVEEVNGAVPQSGVSLVLPLSIVSPLSSSDSSAIREHTSPERRQEEVRKVIEEKLDGAHSEVKHRCPKAWGWKHRLSADGSHIIYDIPNLALLYNRTFVRGSWDCGGRFYADVQNIPSDW